MIVQDPRTAAFSSMPKHAIKAVRPDYCVPLSEIGPLLVRLVKEKRSIPRPKSRARVKPATKLSNRRHAESAPFVCPECSGPLFPDSDAPRGQLKCLVGHTFSPESLSDLHRDALERALLTTMRLLQERGAIQRQFAGVGQRFQEGAADAARDIALLREILERI